LVCSPFSLLVRVFNTGYEISDKARVALRANQFFAKEPCWHHDNVIRRTRYAIVCDR